MPKLVFDIETRGFNFDDLDKNTQENLTRWIKKESQNEDDYNKALDDLKDGLGFSPLTGEIVAIGVLDFDKNQGVVYYQAPGEKFEEYKKGNYSFKQVTEKQMLEMFWNGAREYREFVSFNGRAFDVPFILARSAKYKIRPTKDLMSNRYLSSQKFEAKHIDLQDQLSFYGAVRRKGSLHLWCNLFEITSPKVGGVTGDEVQKLFEEKEYKKIAEYNSGDLTATRELYIYWKEYFDFTNQ
jgi:hypothetical protein